MDTTTDEHVQQFIGSLLSAILAASTGMRVLVKVKYLVKVKEGTAIVYDQDVANDLINLVRKVAKQMDVDTHTMRCPDCIGLNKGTLTVRSEARTTGHYDKAYTLNATVTVTSIKDLKRYDEFIPHGRQDVKSQV